MLHVAGRTQVMVSAELSDLSQVAELRSEALQRLGDQALMLLGPEAAGVSDDNPDAAASLISPVINIESTELDPVDHLPVQPLPAHSNTAHNNTAQNNTADTASAQPGPVADQASGREPSGVSDIETPPSTFLVNLSAAAVVAVVAPHSDDDPSDLSGPLDAFHPDLAVAPVSRHSREQPSFGGMYL